MAKAIHIYETGGPEVLKWEEANVGAPSEGQALITQRAVGLNFIDVYHRSGVYPVPGFPFVPGMEASGVIEEKGGRQLAPPGTICSCVPIGRRTSAASLAGRARLPAFIP